MFLPKHHSVACQTTQLMCCMLFASLFSPCRKWYMCSTLLGDAFVGSFYCSFSNLRAVSVGKGTLFAPIFRLLRKYARKGVSEHSGLEWEEKVVVLQWSSAHGKDQWCQIFHSYILSLLNTPQLEIPLRQRCEAHDDPRALSSLLDISGPSYKMSSSKRCSLWLCFRYSSVFHTKVSLFGALPHHKGKDRATEMSLGLVLTPCWAVMHTSVKIIQS